MMNVLLIIHLLITISLVGIVLIQRSEGGGLGLGGSGGAGGGFMTTRGTANALTRMTVWLADHWAPKDSTNLDPYSSDAVYAYRCTATHIDLSTGVDFDDVPDSDPRKAFAPTTGAVLPVDGGIPAAFPR